MSTRLRSLFSIASTASIAGLLTVALTAACAAPAPTPTPTATPSPVPTPTPTPDFGLPPLTLPADESPHDFMAEWWYFNAHLTAENGSRFALHDVVFQIREPDTARTLYVRQIGLADAATGDHASAERLRSENAPLSAAPGDFSIAFGDGLMSGAGGEEYALRAAVGDYSYDLRLVSTTEPLLHGGIGLLDFQEAGITYYYTRPRLAIEGSLATPEHGVLEVSGLGWLDKQWGDFQPTQAEWDWTSLQLDDGTDLMASLLYDATGAPISQYATLRSPGGEAVHLSPHEFTFTPGEAEWRSPHTGTVFRTEWRVEVPRAGLSLRLQPLSAESEVVGVLLQVAYWESGVDALDASGERVGQGFIELNWMRGADR